MKKLLCLVLVAVFSLGVWGEAQATTSVPRDDIPKWFNVHEDESGDFKWAFRHNGINRVGLVRSVVNADGDEEIHFYVRRKQGFFFAAVKDVAGELDVQWQLLDDHDHIIAVGGDG